MAYKGGGGIGGPRRKVRRKKPSGAAAHPDPPKVTPRRRAPVRSKGAERHPPPRSVTPSVRRRATGGNVFKRPIGRNELASSDPKVRKRQIANAKRAETARKLRRARNARAVAERPVLGPPAPRKPAVHAHPKSGLAAAQAERDVARLKRTARDRRRPLARRLSAERVLRTRHGVVDQDEYLRRTGAKMSKEDAGKLLRDATFGQKPAAKRKLRRAIAANTLPATGDKRGLLKNLERDLDDLVTGAPASIAELAKAGGEQLVKLVAPIAGSGGRRGKPKVKTPASDALVESVKKDDIVYGLITGGPGEAAKRAHRHPLSAIGYATGGGGTALRALNRVHGGTAKAQARPRLRRPEDGGARPTPKGRAGVRQARGERRAAKRRVQARKQGGTPEPERGKVQFYSRAPLVRGAQKARENVRAARGKEPFELRGRRLEREQRRRAEEAAHNEEAGSLEREVVTQKRARKTTKRVARRKSGRVALNLVYAGAVRKGREAEDLGAIAATYERRGDSRNAAAVKRLAEDLGENGERAAIHRARAAADELIAASRRKDERRVKRGELTARQAEYRRAVQGPILRGEVEPSSDLPAGRREPPDKPDKGGTPPSTNGRGPKPAAPIAPSVSPNGKGKPHGPKTKEQVDAERELAELRAERNLIELKLVRNRRRDTGSPRPLTPKRIWRAQAVDRELTAALQQRGVGVPDEGPIDVTATVKALAVRKRADGSVQADLSRLAAAREVLGRVARESDERGTVKAKREHGPMPLREQRKLERRLREVDDELEARGQPSTQRQQERIDRRGPDDPERMAIPAQSTKDGMAKLGHKPHRKAVEDRLSKVGSLERRMRNRGDQELLRRTVKKRKEIEAELAAIVRAEDEAAARAKNVRLRRKGGHQNAEGGESRAPVSEAEKRGQAGAERWDDVGAFLKTPWEENKSDRKPQLSRAQEGFTGESLFELDLTKNHVLGSLGHQERKIGLRRLGEAMLRLSANRTPLGDVAKAQELADELSARGGVRYTVHQEGESSFFVLPEAVMDTWRRQVADHGAAASAGRWITRQFLGAALPLSVTWHAGNTVDLTTRLALAGGIDPRNRAMFEHLRRALHELDPEQADAILGAVKGHVGSRHLVLDPPRLKDVADRLDGAAAKVVGPVLRGASGGRRLPLVRVVPDGGAKLRDWAWDLGTGVEEQLVRQAAGKALGDLAKTMGYELRAHADLGKAVARDMVRDPDLVSEFHRRTVEIVGDYRKLWRQRRFANLLDFTFPFASWMKESIRFTLVTLPAKHPLRLALMAEISAMTERQRREIGASRYVTDAEVQALNELRPESDQLPPPSRGFLAGALKGNPDDGGIPMVPLTSFGEVAGLIQNPLEYALTKPFPWAQKAAGIAIGSNARAGTDLQRRLRDKRRFPSHLHGLERAEASAFWAFESLVPAIKQVHQLRRGGGIPRADSSFLRPRPVPGTEVPLRKNRAVNPLAPSAPEPPSARRRVRRKTRSTGPTRPPRLGF
jgi:hypothetical protein